MFEKRQFWFILIYCFLKNIYFKIYSASLYMGNFFNSFITILSFFWATLLFFLSYKYSNLICLKSRSITYRNENLKDLFLAKKMFKEAKALSGAKKATLPKTALVFLLLWLGGLSVFRTPLFNLIQTAYLYFTCESQKRSPKWQTFNRLEKYKNNFKHTYSHSDKNHPWITSTCNKIL